MGSFSHDTYGECVKEMEKIRRENTFEHKWRAWGSSWGASAREWVQREVEQQQRLYATITGPIAVFPRTWKDLVKDAGPMPKAAAKLLIANWMLMIADGIKQTDTWKNAVGALPKSLQIVGTVAARTLALKGALDKVKQLKDMVDKDPTLDRLGKDVQQLLEETRTQVNEAVNAVNSRQSALAAGGYDNLPWRRMKEVPISVLFTVDLDPGDGSRLKYFHAFRNEGNETLVVNASCDGGPQTNVELKPGETSAPQFGYNTRSVSVNYVFRWINGNRADYDKQRISKNDHETFTLSDAVR